MGFFTDYLHIQHAGQTKTIKEPAWTQSYFIEVVFFYVERNKNIYVCYVQMQSANPACIRVRSE